MFGKGLAAVKAVAGIAHEHINVGAANAEARHRSQGQGAGNKIVEAGFLETNRTLHVHELRDLERDLAGKYADARTGKVERDRVRHVARGYGQGARAAEIEFSTSEAGLVVFQVDIGGRELEVTRVKTIDRHVVSMGLECRVLGASGIFDAEQAKVDAVNPKAVEPGLFRQGYAAGDAVFGIADKGGDVAATNREAFGIEH